MQEKSWFHKKWVKPLLEANFETIIIQIIRNFLEFCTYLVNWITSIIKFKIIFSAIRISILI
jgi:hypothetical protein